MFTIFLPASGYRNSALAGQLDLLGTASRYGSSTEASSDSTRGHRLNFSENHTDIGAETKAHAFSIRCVR